MEGACDGQSHGCPCAAAVSSVGAGTDAQWCGPAGGHRSEDGAEVSEDEAASQRTGRPSTRVANTAGPVRRGLAGSGRAVGAGAGPAGQDAVGLAPAEVSGTV